jgi:AraC-like DNA-binding protein
LSFFSPKQVVIKEPDQISNTGFIILIHPEYIRGHALETKIKSYGFFDYAVNEALILSAEEEDFIENVFIQIEKEFNRPIDHLSQDVIMSSLDLLLTYSNRFYTRQFITRKQHYNTLLVKFEALLDELFEETSLAEKGLPNVADIAAAFHLSSRYFSDLIKEHTGRTTQQHIHDKLIDKAKEMLSVTNLSVSEIAYQLGFQHSQSFSKLFKAKTDQSPLAFRAGFN